MLTIAIPILIGVDSSGDSGVSERTQYYATAKNLMMSGADAMERLMTSYKARTTKVVLAANSNLGPAGSRGAGRLHRPRGNHVRGLRGLLRGEVRQEGRHGGGKAGREIELTMETWKDCGNGK